MTFIRGKRRTSKRQADKWRIFKIITASDTELRWTEQSLTEQDQRRSKTSHGKPGPGCTPLDTDPSWQQNRTTSTEAHPYSLLTWLWSINLLVLLFIIFFGSGGSGSRQPSLCRCLRVGRKFSSVRPLAVGRCLTHRI
jgi:hypothetical protein